MYIIGGSKKNRKILAPKGQETRPSTSKLRESLFNIVQMYVENSSFLDVFAGSGAIGLEALSRGAKKAVFIDANRDSIRCIRENLLLLNFDNQGQLLLGDVFTLLQKLDKQKEKFNIIYVDPPYGTGEISEKLVQFIDQSQLLVPGGMLFIEDSHEALIDKEGWHTLQLKSSRRIGRAPSSFNLKGRKSMKDKNGLLAGSFDPPTLGHLDIIRRASEFCKTLYVGLAENSKKKNPTFSLLEREAMLAEICHDIPNVKISSDSRTCCRICQTSSHRLFDPWA